MGQLIVIVAMFALLWLFLIAPQRRRAQAQRQLISSVEVGNEILTVGGLYGLVRGVNDEDELLVEIAPEVEVRVARRAVAAIVSPGDEELASLEAGNLEPNEEVRS